MKRSTVSDCGVLREGCGLEEAEDLNAEETEEAEKYRPPFSGSSASSVVGVLRFLEPAPSTGLRNFEIPAVAQIVFIDGKYMGTTVSLSPVNTLGREAGNSVVLDEPGIQGSHARIRLANGQYRISRALPSANVLVNGRDVTEEALHHGDIVSLGPLTALFSDEPAPAAAVPAPLPEATGPEASVIESRMKQPTDAAEVITNFRANQRLATHLETLYKVSADLGASLRLDDVINGLIQALFDVLAPDRVFVLLRDETGSLRIAGQRIGETSELQGMVKVSQTIIREALEKREGILTRDAVEDRRFLGGQSIVDQNIRSAMCSPIIKKDRILGAIHVDTLSSMRTFAPIDLQLLGGIAAQAALAIENVLSHERTVDYAKKLVVLGETTRRVSSFLSRDMIFREAVESAARIFDCGMVSLLMLDDEGDALRVTHSTHLDEALRRDIAVRPGQGPAGEVFAENRARRVNDAPVEPTRRYASRSYLIVPIVARRERLSGEARPVGVLCVTDRRSRKPFEEEDQEILTIFASQLGTSLQTARFFEKATVDGLTQLFTRQFFFARLEEEVESHRRQGAPLSVIMMDLDHFKKKNDEYGHAAGDAILFQTASRAKEIATRAGGLAGRYGGEEFTVLLPGRPLAPARDVAEEIRRAIEASPCTYDGQSIPCSASLGVAQLSAAEGHQEVVRRADAALYMAKKGGRNRVESSPVP